MNLKKLIGSALILSIVFFTFLKFSEDAPLKKSLDVLNQDKKNDQHSESQVQIEARQTSHDAQEVSDASISTTLALHKEWAKYPPNSRPLEKEAVDLINPNFVEEPLERPKFTDDANNIAEAEFFCRFQPLKHRNTPKQKSVELHFYCLDGANDSYPVEIQVVSGIGNNPNKNWIIKKNQLSYKMTSIKHNELIEAEGWIISYENSDSNWGDISITLDYKDPLTETEYKTTKLFVVNNRDVGEFTNNFREYLTDGSLIIEAEVEIYAEGWYRFDANLKNDQDYIAASSYEKHLGKGKNYVPFLFFGKIFHDKQANGPYTVTSIRGHKITYPAEDALELPPDQFEATLELTTFDHPTSEPLEEAQSYQTQYYDLDSFSNLAYTSEENSAHQQRLINLQAQ